MLARFEVVLSKKAQKYYKKVPISVAKRLDRAFLILEDNPVSGADVKQLAGKVKRYRMRVGDVRIIFQIDNKLKRVEVTAILPRGEVYKKL